MKVEYNAESQIFGGSILGDVYSNITGQRFSDERHTPLITDQGVKIAEYAGPGTHIKYRLENNIEPLTLVDKISKAHDLRYSLSKNIDDVRYADNKMISKLDEIDKKGLDYKLNVKAVKTAMKSKRLFEDVGVWSKGSFSDMKGAELPEEDKRLFETELNKLVQEGFGLAGQGNVFNLPSDAGKYLPKGLFKGEGLEDININVPSTVPLPKSFFKSFKGQGLSPFTQYFKDKGFFDDKKGTIFEKRGGSVSYIKTPFSIENSSNSYMDFMNLGEKLFSQNPLEFKSLLDTSLDKIIVGKGLKESMGRAIKKIIYGALPFLQWFDSDKTILQGRGLKQF